MFSWIVEQVGRLPPQGQVWFWRLNWVFIACVALWILWRLMRSTKTLPHGEVKTDWHAPGQWSQRWEQIKAENARPQPEWYGPFVRLVQGFSKLIGVFMLSVLLVTVVALGLVQDGWLWWLVSSILSGLLLWFMYWYIKK